MAAFKVPFKILQGETYNEVSTWKTGAPAVAVDLTGCTARLQVRSDIDSPVVLLELTTENGGIELGGVLGTVRRVVTATATAAFAWTAGVYDLEVVFANGTVRRLMAGPTSVSKEVTRV
jgi:hypothetical protein